MADAVDLGPAASIALLIPITFRLSAVQAIIMLGGIYYGAMYGGSTTSILINVPGEAASVVTCLDGYQMARKGRAGPALGIAAFGSFIAGTAGTLLIMLLAPPLSAFALQFGPPEFVGLVFLGLTMVTYLSSGSMMKSLLMAVVGSMYVGNGMLLLLNLPLIWIWVNFLEIPYSILFPFILLFCLIGVYTVGNSVTDIYIMILFGILGYGMKKCDYEPAPFVLAFVLGPMFENAFRQSMIMSDSNPVIFLSRPISAAFVLISLFVLASPLILRRMGKKRPGLLVKED